MAAQGGVQFGGSSGIVVAYYSAAFLSGSSRWGTIWWQQWDSGGILFSSLYKWQLKVGYNFGGSGGIVCHILQCSGL